MKEDPDGKILTPVDTCMSTIKPVHAEWVINAHHYVKGQPEIIINGFKAAGILGLSYVHYDLITILIEFTEHLIFIMSD